jgi:hypothetical protein
MGKKREIKRMSRAKGDDHTPSHLSIHIHFHSNTHSSLHHVLATNYPYFWTIGQAAALCIPAAGSSVRSGNASFNLCFGLAEPCSDRLPDRKVFGEAGAGFCESKAEVEGGVPATY